MTCNVFWVLNRFFALSEVTWMLNEALFLLKLLFRTFDAKSYFWAFFVFGWGKDINIAVVRHVSSLALPFMFLNVSFVYNHVTDCKRMPPAWFRTLTGTCLVNVRLYAIQAYG